MAFYKYVGVVAVVVCKDDTDDIIGRLSEQWTKHYYLLLLSFFITPDKGITQIR